MILFSSHPAQMLFKISFIDKFCQRILFQYRYGTGKSAGSFFVTFHQIRKVYEGTGAVCEMLPMGEDGIRSDVLAQTRADVLHVTPFHSFPSGVTATIGKRYEYLEWAREKHHFIVEDDFDSEFFMPGKPVETLFMLDDSSSVIYINTFSKSLSPSIRMGYMTELLSSSIKNVSTGLPGIKNSLSKSSSTIK